MVCRVPDYVGDAGSLSLSSSLRALGPRTPRAQLPRVLSQVWCGQGALRSAGAPSPLGFRPTPGWRGRCALLVHLEERLGDRPRLDDVRVFVVPVLARVGLERNPRAGEGGL